MRIITKYLKYYNSTSTPPTRTPIQNYSFPYPYEYTLCPQQFKYIDYRFEQYPVVQKFFPPEQEHIRYVFQLFQKLFNKNISQKATSQFIDSKLIQKVRQYRQILKSMESSAQIKIHAEKIDQSSGYLQYYGFKPQLFIHQYIVTKDDEKLVLVQKQQLKQLVKKQGEEQLKKDMQEISNQTSVAKKIKQKMFKNNKNDRKKQLGMKILDFFQNSYDKSRQNKKFKKYYLINSINTKMNVQLVQNGKIQAAQKYNDILLNTKWYYHVTGQESQSIKKSRKKILFDFQMWNRGTFIPIKNFVE